MSIVKIGIQTRSLRQPLRQALETASRLGADGVEIDARTELPPAELSQTGIRQFRKLLDDLNLRLRRVVHDTARLRQSGRLGPPHPGHAGGDEIRQRSGPTSSSIALAACRTMKTNLGLRACGSAHRARRVRRPRGSAVGGANGDGKRPAAGAAARGAAARNVGVDLQPSGLIQHGYDVGRRCRP